MKYLLSLLLIFNFITVNVTPEPAWEQSGDPEKIVFNEERFVYVNYNKFVDSWMWGHPELLRKATEPIEVPAKNKVSFELRTFWASKPQDYNSRFCFLLVCINIARVAKED